MTGAELIAAERARQIEAEGFSLERDRLNFRGCGPGDPLGMAAIAYTVYACVDDQFDVVMTNDEGDVLDVYPDGWAASFSPAAKEHSSLRSLVIAGALIAAELDRRMSHGEKQ